MQPQQKSKATRRWGLIVLVVAVVLTLAFFVPVFTTRLSPEVWYPYTAAPSGLGSVTYTYLGVGAVYWAPNHYWLYFGNSVVQLTNSSASSITVNSIDQNGTTIFGYYSILSDSGGNKLATGYTQVTFPTTACKQYAVQMEGYGKCAFSHWSTAATSSELVVTAKRGGKALDAVYHC